ncbi:MAG: hypothetical protein GY841_17295 [FCB group bacterium]|nr:hypothetical protein [FCB group bacterium]
MPIIDEPEAEPGPWKGDVGLAQSLWTGGLLDKLWGFHPTHKDTHVFLCGHPEMIRETTNILEAEGFQEHTRRAEGQIHSEIYF